MLTYGLGRAGLSGVLTSGAAVAGPGDALTTDLGRTGPGGALTFGGGLAGPGDLLTSGSGRDLVGPDSEIEATDGRAGGDVGAAGN